MPAPLPPRFRPASRPVTLERFMLPAEKRLRVCDQLVAFRAIVGPSVPESVLTDCLSSCEGQLERAVDMFFAKEIVEPRQVSEPLNSVKEQVCVSECISLGSFNCVGGLTTKLAAAANELYMDTPLDCSFSIRPPTVAVAATPAHLMDLIHGSGFIRFNQQQQRSPIGRLPAPIAAALCPLVRLGLVEVAIQVGYPGCAGQHLNPGASVPLRVNLALPPAALARPVTSAADDPVVERIHSCWTVLLRQMGHESIWKKCDDEQIPVDEQISVDDQNLVNNLVNEQTLVDEEPPVVVVSVEMERFSDLFAKQDLPLTFPPSDVFPTQLKAYQAQAVSWMRARETNDDPAEGWLNINGIYYHEGFFAMQPAQNTHVCRGGILADEMGLGKTVMTLALICLDNDGPPIPPESKVVHPANGLMSFLVHPEVEPLPGGTLVVVHLSLLSQWIGELKRHAPGLSYLVFHGTGRPRDPVVLSSARVVFSTYGTIAADDSLLTVAWRRIVLDEAHTIRTRGTKMARAVGKLTAERRWCLTGTPLQNSVEDIYPLVAWLRVPNWRSFAYFRKQILVPNLDLQAAQAMLRPLMLRRTKATKDASGVSLVTLPTRTNKVIYVQLSAEEKDFYRALFWQTKLEFDKFEKSNQVMYNITHILQLLVRLRQALCHPLLCKSALLAPSAESCSLSELLAKFVDSNLPPAYVGNLMSTLAEGLIDCPICLDEPCQFPVLTPCGHTLCRKCCVNRPRRECPICRHVFANTEIQSLAALGDQPTCPPLSSKLSMLLKYVRRDMKMGRKVVVFSQFVSFIDIIGKVFEAKNVSFKTLHGGHTSNQREAAVLWLASDTEHTESQVDLDQEEEGVLSDHEKETHKGPGRVLLVSLKAGGVGLNLVAANVVYLTDLWWNPAVEEQAFQRVHRLGQVRPVFTYKFVCSDTIDERILDLQATKNAMTCDLLGDMQTGTHNGGSRKLTLEDIRQLFKPTKSTD